MKELLIQVEINIMINRNKELRQREQRLRTTAIQNLKDKGLLDDDGNLIKVAQE